MGSVSSQTGLLFLCASILTSKDGKYWVIILVKLTMPRQCKYVTEHVMSLHENMHCTTLSSLNANISPTSFSIIPSFCCYFKLLLSTQINNHTFHLRLFTTYLYIFLLFESVLGLFYDNSYNNWLMQNAWFPYFSSVVVFDVIVKSKLPYLQKKFLLISCYA